MLYGCPFPTSRGDSVPETAPTLSDHPRIVSKALDQRPSPFATTTLARRLSSPLVTIRHVTILYESILGTKLDVANFQPEVLPSGRSRCD